MQNKISGIYLIIHKTSGKVYVGQSVDIYRRWKQHKAYLRNNTHENHILQNTWNKYGENDFEFMIIHECSQNIDELNALEIEYIEKYQALDRNKGFNIAKGGCNNGNTLAGFTEEEYKLHCNKMKQVKKEYYKTHTAFWKGKELPRNFREKGVESARIRNTGRKREKHSILMTGSGNPRAKKVMCIDTGEVFGCAKEAGEKYGVTNSTILKTCKGKQKTTAGKQWCFC